MSETVRSKGQFWRIVLLSVVSGPPIAWALFVLFFPLTAISYGKSSLAEAGVELPGLSAGAEIGTLLAVVVLYLVVGSLFSYVWGGLKAALTGLAFACRYKFKGVLSLPFVLSISAAWVVMVMLICLPGMIALPGDADGWCARYFIVVVALVHGAAAFASGLIIRSVLPVVPAIPEKKI